jgi:APA family basic amino acid/polyamine antiporter
MSETLRPVFARNSTGLVRQISPFDAFLFNQSFINAGLILLLSLLFVPAFYPGASLLLAALVGTLIALPTALVHGSLAAAFPRSGGDYVYNSRILHPVLGFAGNWNITIWLLIYAGFGAYAFSQYGLVPLFRFLGVHGVSGCVGAAQWIATPWGTFLSGLAALVIVTAVYILQTRLVARLQRWLFLFGLASLIALIVALLSCSPHEFASRFDAYAAQAFGVQNAAQHLLTRAPQLGFQASVPFSLAATWIAFYFIANWFFWGNASTYLGGEVQRAERTQLITLPLAALVTGGLVCLSLFGFQHAVTPPLLGAIGYVLTMAPNESIPVIYSEMAAIAAGNPWLGGFVLFGALYWPLAFLLAPIGPTTRNLLAWSLDQLVPEGLSSLHPRTNTPVAAIALCASLAAIGLGLFSFFPAFSAMVGVIGAFLTYILTSLSAAVLPFRRGFNFESMPVRWRLSRVPVITILGVLSLIGILICDASVLSDPYSGISLSPAVDAGKGKGIPFIMFLINLGIFLSGFAVYALAALVQRRRGVDVSLAFQQIPPE